MKAGRVLLISPVIVMVISIASFSEDKYVAKPDKELYQTWVNENMYPQKTVDFLGGFKDYSLILDKSPSSEGTEQIMSKWTDSDNNIWYKTFGTFTKGQFAGMGFQRLIELSESATVMEIVMVLHVYSYNPKYYAAKIDPHSETYRVYHLGGF